MWKYNIESIKKMFKYKVEILTLRIIFVKFCDFLDNSFWQSEVKLTIWWNIDSVKINHTVFVTSLHALFFFEVSKYFVIHTIWNTQKVVQL